ncbi:hypothetical protein BDY21DRAFT_331832 [Lineolata rhizophorae]|uniref:Shugoshin C-terminal domain-containing protein n=1 Tax=Lineolata rhizophorae TaxID=578093 RepID=A0A6A6PC06_9PEZI|nr:hypothetical protein BDY21DRAFT_331832 [Lineolata rhizophorae]
MARLNDSASMSAESIDALKRRFVRQNRELAKNNSAQSVRIRGLESELARAVGENLVLREQIISLQTQLETQQHARHVGRSIAPIRDTLQSKVAELSALVADLSALEQPRRRKSCGRSRRSDLEQLRAARRRGADGEVLDEEQEGKLPTIHEDKNYPRQTLDHDERRAILKTGVDGNDDNDWVESPELGPPPVAHFDNNVDPIKFGAEETHDEPCLDTAEELASVLPANLETRKKRRDGSGGRGDGRRISIFHERPENDRDGTELPDRSVDSGAELIKRTGTKRKFGAEEDSAAIAGVEDEFLFNRKLDNTTGAIREEGRVDKSPTKASQQTKVQVSRTREPQQQLARGDRKILGEKPVNTDSVASPRKPASKPSEDPRKMTLLTSKPPRGRHRDRKRAPNLHSRAPESHDPITLAAGLDLEPQEPPTVEIPPPETPFVDQHTTSTPTSTAPSTSTGARPKIDDTPPPGATSAMGASGRAARRGRAPVSYAEPNLVSKMRRPGKELLDAVAPGASVGVGVLAKEGRESLSRRSSVVADDPKSGSAAGSAGTGRVRKIVIKKEKDAILSGPGEERKKLPLGEASSTSASATQIPEDAKPKVDYDADPDLVADMLEQGGEAGDGAQQLSPLSKKSSARASASTLGQANANAGVTSQDQSSGRIKQSGSAGTISALLAGSCNGGSKRKSTVSNSRHDSASTAGSLGQKNSSTDNLVSAIKSAPAFANASSAGDDTLAVFDFSSSPPSGNISGAGGLRPGRPELARARSSRRHSTMGNLTPSSGGVARPNSVETDAVKGSDGKTHPSGTRSTRASGKMDSRERKERDSNEQDDEAGTEADEDKSKRDKGAASRRRSMML